MTQKRQPGTFYGVGVGPGDADLITLKGWRLLQNAPVISYLCNEQGHSQSRSIIQQHLPTKQPKELAIMMPMCNDRTVANQIYSTAAASIAECLQQGQDVVFLCEGDPLFFGSCSYLMEKLCRLGNFGLQVVPGVPAMQAASARLLLPLTQLKESMAVVSGRHSEDFLLQTLTSYDSVVIMKAGVARAKILSALTKAGRLQDARYLENVGRTNEEICRDVTALESKVGPYFSIFLVTPNRAGDGAE